MLKSEDFQDNSGINTPFIAADALAPDYWCPGDIWCQGTDRNITYTCMYHWQLMPHMSLEYKLPVF